MNFAYMLALLVLGVTAGETKWDAFERVHAHGKVFHGVVIAPTEKQALSVAKQKYGTKVTEVVPYFRQGAIPLSDEDLGCYKFGGSR